ncbi:MAG: excinuclease ABC subunit UvrC, partial [Actinomycetota bacterium]
GAVSPDEHRQIVMELCDFLDGNTKPVLDRLEAEMREHAGNQGYEMAAKLRDQLISVRKAVERQEMVSEKPEDFDVIGLADDDLEAAFQVFFVRRGRVTGRKGFIVDKVEELTTEELIERFIERLYVDAEVPKNVFVPSPPDDSELLERWLGELRGSKVKVQVPQRGSKRQLLETVNENAREAFSRHKLKRSSDFASRAKQLRRLQEELGLEDAPLRIECFDISNTGPTEAVGSMVVFEDGLPKRSDYRRFKIRWNTQQDDFANMGEVVRRRFARYLEESDAEARPGRFAYPPNLVVIDGGKGQLNRAVEVMDEMGLSDVAVVSLAKRMEEVFLPGRPEPVIIPRGSDALYLLQQIRDEAHRFALAYHRLRRGKKMTQSILDDVPGLGEVRRKRLLKTFGSVKRMREASLEDLRAVPGLPDSVADTLYEVLHPGGPPDEREAS